MFADRRITTKPEAMIVKTEKVKELSRDTDGAQTPAVMKRPAAAPAPAELDDRGEAAAESDAGGGSDYDEPDDTSKQEQEEQKAPRVRRTVKSPDVTPDSKRLKLDKVANQEEPREMLAA
eukprot:4525978-Pyramimonas_sp.AAC.1